MVNSGDWFWASDYGRDRMLREELEAQAGALAASSARQRRETSKLRSELQNIQGSLETRLNALTNAFIAFVELDGIRKQLTAFPQHAEARRLAIQDLQVLLDGGAAPRRPDVDGYWLPPAMSALRPDGSVDPEPAALARQRDPHAAPVFLAVARAALGAGENVVTELPMLLSPDDRGTWAEWQLLLWGAVLRGAFGPAALTTLTATFRPLITGAGDWPDWARSQAGTSDAKALEWVTSQLKDLAPQGTPEQETGWTATGTGRPDFVIQGSGRTRGASHRLTPEPEPEETTEETSPGENAWESTRALLVQVLQVHIRGGSEDEHALLARAELLEEQFTNPLGASELPDEVPEKRHVVVDVLRRTALDDHASRQDRRRLWLLIAEAFQPVAREWQAEPEPRVPEEKVPGHGGLTVGPDGVHDQTAVRALMRRYDSQRPDGLILRGREIMWAGAATAGASIVLLITARSGWFLLLALAGIAAAVLGYKMNETAEERRNVAESLKNSLTRHIEDATRTAAGKYEKARTGHAERQESVSRFLTVFRSSS